MLASRQRRCTHRRGDATVAIQQPQLARSHQSRHQPSFGSRLSRELGLCLNTTARMAELCRRLVIAQNNCSEQFRQPPSRDLARSLTFQLWADWAAPPSGRYGKSGGRITARVDSSAPSLGRRRHCTGGVDPVDGMPSAISASRWAVTSRRGAPSGQPGDRQREFRRWGSTTRPCSLGHRGYQTICSKLYAKPKKHLESEAFTNDRLRMDMPGDGFLPIFITPGLPGL